MPKKLVSNPHSIISAVCTVMTLRVFSCKTISNTQKVLSYASVN